MPELPEVETTLRGIAPYLEGQTLTRVDVRIPKLRTQLDAPTLAAALTGATLTNLRRRNKYLLADTDRATTLLLHLGMSGRLSLHPATNAPPLLKHDHISLFTRTHEVRFNDARRFGLFVLLPTAHLITHPLLANLGPEPLDNPRFTAAYLHHTLQITPAYQPIKVALMHNQNVVGIGNIYASESLFRAKIHPQTPARSLTLAQCKLLITKIKQTLNEAIAAGGSTLRDFQHADGNLGYFQKSFYVYGRKGQNCLICATPIQNAVLAQRNTFWCATCQLPFLPPRPPCKAVQKGAPRRRPGPTS